MNNRHCNTKFDNTFIKLFILISKSFLPLYALTGLDLTTHYSAGGDDTTKPRHQGDFPIELVGLNIV
jgi:hypothetical protein